LAEISNPNLQAQGPGGGSGGGDMRSMLAIMMLAMAGLFAYQYFFAKPLPTETPASQTQAQTPAAPTPVEQPLPGATGQQASASQPLVLVPGIMAPSETETTVENDQYKIVFTNKGAQVKNWILKNYTDSAGKPLDMVQQQAAAHERDNHEKNDPGKIGLPLSLYTYEPSLTDQLNSALFQPSATGILYAPNSLTFHYAANGLDVVKTFRFDSSYVVDIEAQVKRDGVPVRALVQWPAGLGDMEEFIAKNNQTSGIIPTSTSSLFTWSIGGKQDSAKAKDVSGINTLNLPYEYAAVTDLYFAAAMMPDNSADASVVTLHNSIDLPNDPKDPNSKITPAPVLGLAMGDTNGYTRLRLYAGPKELDILKSVHAIGADGKADGQALDPLIQYGWLTVIAKPLYLALRYLHEHGIPNWGWAIIVVTVIFNLVMFPTRLMMMKSSLKMQRIAPKVDAIKRKYASLKATDPKKAEMQTEMMALYNAEGINMYGGCLPMLLQMPLFFAYYRVLLNAVELRHAHWFWLSDLSVPDPLYILPVIIIVSMFLTQWITPAAGMDPAQRKMMAFMMPAIMGFTMLHFASGLALYWCTGNLINLAIQLIINQSPMGKEMHAISAKRAAKKGGGGSPKTIQAKR
jgi:YidC/Oxa1 family membrane protein insertase